MDLPWSRLVIVILELERGHWYVKVIDRRTRFHASAGGRREEPLALVSDCWRRLVAQGVAP